MFQMLSRSMHRLNVRHLHGHKDMSDITAAACWEACCHGNDKDDAKLGAGFKRNSLGTFIERHGRLQVTYVVSLSDTGRTRQTEGCLCGVIK